MSKANLYKAFLYNTDLRGADLSQAVLCDASAKGANLSEANLSKADLQDVNLRGADLRGAGATVPEMMRVDEDLLRLTLSDSSEQLDRQAAFLEGATMPNGQKYEDWIKSRNQEENGMNEGSS